MKVYVNTANKGKLNLRETASSSGKILTQIPYGTELEVDAITAEWTKVAYKFYFGYVKSEFLTENMDNTKTTLHEVYNSLKQTLATIEKAMK